jgi:hypothetical protein
MFNMKTLTQLKNYKSHPIYQGMGEKSDRGQKERQKDRRLERQKNRTTERKTETLEHISALTNKP